MICRPWEPDLTFCCHSLVTNEQTSNSRRFDGWHGWLQGCGFSDSELFPEFRFAKLELSALLQKTYYCPNELRALFNKIAVQTDVADFAQFAQIIEYF